MNSQINQPSNVIRKFLTSTYVLTFLTLIILFVGILLIRYGSEKVGSPIGTSLIASAIVTLATLWINYIKTEEEKLLTTVKKRGIINIHSSRSLTGLYQPLLEKVDNVDVTGYSLGGFLSQSLQIIQKRAAEKNPIRMRILLVSPESEASERQATVENSSPDTYRIACENLIRDLGSIEQVEIKYIDHALPIMIYRLGNRLFTGHYSAKSQSKSSSTVTFEIDQSGELFDIYMDEFNALWKEGRKAC